MTDSMANFPERTTDLAGKRILVTGGTTGIGRAAAALLAEAGGRVFVIGREPKALADCLAAVNDRGGTVSGMTADIATREGVAAVFDAVDQAFGGLDMLVACAALGAEPIHEMAEEEWRYVVETNFTGCLASARAGLCRMGAGSHILLVGSIATDIKKPGESVYAATKAGVRTFAETLRKEVAPRGIKVSVVEPGSTATDMQRCSDAEKAEAVARDEMLHAVEVAEAILFVLTRSPRADIVNLRIEPRMQRTQ